MKEVYNLYKQERLGVNDMPRHWISHKGIFIAFQIEPGRPWELARDMDNIFFKDYGTVARRDKSVMYVRRLRAAEILEILL